MRASTVWNKAAAALAVALIAVNVYRAGTQSITSDEAFTFNSFVAEPFAEGVRFYDANNHPLNTLLIRASTALFGVSELSVRLPALAGGALYLAFALRLCFLAFGASGYALLCFAAMALNPFVLDFLSAARGYGMALAFLMVAMDALARYIAEGARMRLYAAGAALGLTVVSNLAFALPAAGLAAVFAAVLLRNSASKRAALSDMADHFAVPGIITAFVIVAIPLSHAGHGAYYYGAKSLAEMVESLVLASFTAPAGASPVFAAKVMQHVMQHIAWFHVAAALLAAACVAAFLTTLRRPGGGVATLAAGTIAVTLAGAVAAHNIFGVPYPMDRTGIYWAPLAVLAAFGLAHGRTARIAVAAVGLLCVTGFVLQFRTAYYGAWLDDAGAKRMIAFLRARENGARRVRIAGSWQFEPALNFYRRMYRLDWLEPVGRGGPSPGAAYHAFVAAEAPMASRLGLEVIYRDPLSGGVLAE